MKLFSNLFCRTEKDPSKEEYSQLSETKRYQQMRWISLMTEGNGEYYFTALNAPMLQNTWSPERKQEMLIKLNQLTGYVDHYVDCCNVDNDNIKSVRSRIALSKRAIKV